jgi:DNA primase
MINQDQELLDQLSNLGIDIVKIDKREIVARCPIHNDHNPSFFFNLDSQLFHCFQECLHGKGISQLKYQLTGEITKFSDVDVKLPIYVKRSFVPRIPVLPLAIDNEGEKYLISRYFTKETIKSWNLMYWSEPNGIVIPIEKVGYILRYIKPEDLKKKYKYIAGTKIQTTLFGIEKFESKDHSAILSEGAFDVIYLHQLGYRNALGLLHSDISEDQIKQLRGATNIIKLVIDNDLGGQEILKKIIPKLRREFIVKVFELPDGKDPNDCTPNQIEKVLKNK